MKFVVTFNDTGTEGVMVFTAIDMEDAYRFISDPNNFYDPSKVSTPVPFSGNIADLYKMFPLKRGSMKKVDWRVFVQWLCEGLLSATYPPLIGHLSATSAILYERSLIFAMKMACYHRSWQEN